MLDAETVVEPAAPVDIRNRHAGPASWDLRERLAALPLLSHAELRAEWRRLYRAHPAQKIGRDLLELAVAWKLQERALGGISAATKRKLAELAAIMESKGDLTKARAVKLRPGAKLVREWRGKTHDVLVTESGFLWRGESWRSLSAIAREITGAHWSGPRFFGLKGTEKRGTDDSGATEVAVAEGEPAYA